MELAYNRQRMQVIGFQGIVYAVLFFFLLLFLRSDVSITLTARQVSKSHSLW